MQVKQWGQMIGLCVWRTLCHLTGDNVPGINGQSVPGVNGQNVPPLVRD